jgi:deoxyribodipyrimidine photo-lyase
VRKGTADSVRIRKPASCGIPSSVPTTIVWFRTDLRLADNPALAAAIRRGFPVLPVFIHSPEEEQPWRSGAASNWWLHHSLRALDASLRGIGSRLLIHRGPALATLRELVRSAGATAVYWNRRYEPAVITRDTAVKTGLAKDGLEAESFNSALLFEPWAIKTGTGTPYRVFTPYWRACLSSGAQPAEPLPGPEGRLATPRSWPRGVDLRELKLEPAADWAGGFHSAWVPGEHGARARFDHFAGSLLANYPTGRDRPAMPGVSRLSPHLHFGELSPRSVWRSVSRIRDSQPGSPLADAAASFLRQLIWREFSYHLLYHCPETADEPLRPEFSRFPWRRSEAALKRWQKGNTGYPFVDAGMRELWTTGYMHNRLRMVVASFVTKHLMIKWQEGARWFWDTLVDADLANNTFGWQWTAGCGADAAPYFRIFNPVSQGEKLDPEGDYVRRWVPELAALPSRWIHQPWAAPVQVLERAGVKIGQDYPAPIVDHAEAREQALAAYAVVRTAPRSVTP